MNRTHTATTLLETYDDSAFGKNCKGFGTNDSARVDGKKLKFGQSFFPALVDTRRDGRKRGKQSTKIGAHSCALTRDLGREKTLHHSKLLPSLLKVLKNNN